MTFKSEIDAWIESIRSAFSSIMLKNSIMNGMVIIKWDLAMALCIYDSKLRGIIFFKNKGLKVELIVIESKNKSESYDKIYYIVSYWDHIEWWIDVSDYVMIWLEV